MMNKPRCKQNHFDDFLAIHKFSGIEEREQQAWDEIVEELKWQERKRPSYQPD